MNKQQEKAYAEYVRSEKERGIEDSDIMERELWLAEVIRAEEQEKADYLSYQKKIATRNDTLKADEQDREEILTKEEWLKAGKPSGKGKHEKFSELVEKRASKALEAIEKLKPLYNPNYESTLEERKQVITALKDTVAKLEAHFTAEKAKKSTIVFKLQAVQETLPQNPS